MARTDVLRPISETFGQIGAQEPMTESSSSKHPHTYIKGNVKQDKFILEIQGYDWPAQINIVDVKNNTKDSHTIPVGEYNMLQDVIEKFIKCNNEEAKEEIKEETTEAIKTEIDEENDIIANGTFFYTLPF